MRAEELFLANLGLIDRIATFVCRRNHLNADEAEEFTAHVRLKLIDNDYAVLRKFEGRSSLPTYLTTVIHRLFLEYRVELWGRWRPSAEAKRLGDKAITLERMLTRDGYSFAEAIEVLTTGSNRAFTRAEVEAIYLRLPPRTPRPSLVTDASLPDTIASREGADDGLLRADRLHAACAAATALDAAIHALDAEDQLILRMRFWAARRVSDIAAALGIDQKKLYKRIERLLSGIRDQLHAAGIDAADIEELLAHDDHEIWRKSENGRSHTSDADLQMKSGADGTGDAAL